MLDSALFAHNKIKGDAVKLKVQDLSVSKPKEITFTGNESWLKTLYTLYGQSPSGSSSKTLHGKVILHRVDEYYLQITGSWSFNLLVDCGRCAEEIPLPLSDTLDLQVKVTVPKHTRTQEPRELDLTENDFQHSVSLDGYIDLFDILNESISFKNPMCAVPIQDVQGNCTQCGVSRKSSCVYSSSSKETTKTSAFSKLKSLETT